MWVLSLFCLPLCFAATARSDNDNIDEYDFPPNIDEKSKQEIIQTLTKNGLNHCFSTRRKSPIDIDLSNVTIVSFPKLRFHGYHQMETVSESIANNFTVTIRGYKNWTEKPILSGGPLKGKYHLIEVYWDMVDLHMMNSYFYYGDTVNNAKHDGEVYFVHTRDGMSLEEARLIPGSIVIVAVFISQELQSTRDIRPFINDTSYALPEKTGTEFTWIAPEMILPDQKDSYFLYNGTFSHPPCIGDVTWIIMSNPVELTSADATLFLHSKRGTHATLAYMKPKRRDGAEVFFNHPTRVPILTPLPNGQTLFYEIVDGAIAVFFLGIIIYAIAQKYLKKKDQIVDYRVGFDNQNFDPVAHITPLSL